MAVRTMVDILIVEPGKEDGILNKIVDFISSRTQCRVTICRQI